MWVPAALRPQLGNGLKRCLQTKSLLWPAAGLVDTVLS
jgi:hypothetical protein